jgi:NADH dehydrogenase
MLADCIPLNHDSETLELGGPEVLTLADVTKLVYRASGKSVTVLPMPMILAGIGLSLADPLPFVPFGTDQFKSLSFDNTVLENDISAFDVEPADLRTFEDYLGLESGPNSSRK